MEERQDYRSGIEGDSLDEIEGFEVILFLLQREARESEFKDKMQDGNLGIGIGQGKAREDQLGNAIFLPSDEAQQELDHVNFIKASDHRDGNIEKTKLQDRTKE